MLRPYHYKIQPQSLCESQKVQQRRNQPISTASDQSPVTSHQSPVTSHQSPVTSHQSPLHIAQRNNTPPVVYPAPTAANNTKSPFFNLFSAIASRIPSGIVPAVVFPYRSIFTITLESSTPKRSCIARIILKFAWCGTTSARSSPL